MLCGETSFSLCVFSVRILHYNSMLKLPHIALMPCVCVCSLS